MKWFTDFSEYDADAAPGDWTPSGAGWSQQQTVQVIDDATFGRVLHKSTGTWHELGGFLAWDEPGLIAGDVEVLVKVRATVAEGYEATAVRCSEAGQGFLLSDASNAPVNVNSRVTAKSVAHADLSAGSYADSGVAPDQWVWIRLRLSDGNVLMSRAWQDGQAEPDSWLSSLDLSGSAFISNIVEGKVGIGWANINAACYIAAFGVTDSPATESAPASLDDMPAERPLDNIFRDAPDRDATLAVPSLEAAPPKADATLETPDVLSVAPKTGATLAAPDVLNVPQKREADLTVPTPPTTPPKGSASLPAAPDGAFWHPDAGVATEGGATGDAVAPPGPEIFWLEDGERGE